jgi:uncharacterized protein with NRDE domain
MCTLIALSRVNPEVPLVVAANRDEFYARPWAPPAVLRESPRIVGGSDLVQRGTWLGATGSGLFAAVTNQRTYGAADPTKRSRGELVLEALATGSVEAALGWLEGVDARTYNPFNLLIGDSRALHVVYARGDARVMVEALPPGIWVLNNDTIGSRDFPKANRAKELVTPFAREPWDSLAGKLMSALGDHERPPIEEIPAPPPGAPLSREVLRELQAICVHTVPYGTGSASVLAIGEDRVEDYRFAPGPPCVTPFESVRERFSDQGQRTF